jgi:hypothetical protein
MYQISSWLNIFKFIPIFIRTPVLKLKLGLIYLWFWDWINTGLQIDSIELRPEKTISLELRPEYFHTSCASLIFQGHTSCITIFFFFFECIPIINSLLLYLVSHKCR